MPSIYDKFLWFSVIVLLTYQYMKFCISVSVCLHQFVCCVSYVSVVIVGISAVKP